MSDEQASLDFEAQDRRGARLVAIQYLHWRAFVAHWNTDGHRGDNHAAMKSAFKKQQQSMAAGKILVSVRFTSGVTTAIGDILRSDTDPMLSAIYVEGLTVKVL